MNEADLIGANPDFFDIKALPDEISPCAQLPQVVLNGEGGYPSLGQRLFAS